MDLRQRSALAIGGDYGLESDSSNHRIGRVHRHTHLQPKKADCFWLRGLGSLQRGLVADGSRLQVRMAEMNFIGSCLAFVAASLFLWKRPMGHRGLFPAGALLLFTAAEIRSAAIRWMNQ